MIIVLTGFMGSGKTTVGRKLADALGCAFADLDEEVGSIAGRPVPAIIRESGEAAFRRLELSTLRKVMRRAGKEAHGASAKWDMVLSLGGGTILQQPTRSLLAGRSFIIYLKAGADTLAERLSGEAESRPLLAGPDLRSRIAELLAQRAETYEKSASLTILTDGLTPAQIAEQIEKAVINSYG